MGYYCTEGTASETPCPIGTFRDAVGGTSLTDCIICDAGQYCQIPALVTPGTGPCGPGFYCPEGQDDDTPVSYECEKGNYCPGGTKVQYPCELG